MMIIRVLGGSLGKAGELTSLTVLKLRMALFLAKRLREKGVSYEYVFPQGRRTAAEKQRPCDVMSLWTLQRDPYCFKVNVPASEEDLVTRQERLDFVKSVAAKRSAKVLRQRDFRKVKGLKPSDFEEGSSHDTYLDEVGSNVFQIRL
jgi:hypothetical protein